MTKFNLMKRFFILTLFSVLIFSCQKAEIESFNSNEQGENFVSIEEVTGIASIIEYPIADNIDLSGSIQKKSPKSKFKNVESVNAIPDENGVTSYYIINYKDDGFVIISADNRINPILAFSNSAKFPLDKDVYPNGIVEWLVGAKDYIRSVRESNLEQTYYTAQAWDPCAIQSQIQLDEFEDDPCNPDDGSGGGSDDNGCQNEYETVGPFLQTTWGQFEGYNNLLPYSGCSEIDNRRPPTGCVATAMCQVVRYHQYPDSYNYSIMPNIIWRWDDMSSNGVNEVARLMKDAGVAVNMGYGCDGSGADIEDVPSAFINDFGYSNAIYAGFNREIVVSNLRKNRPVILSGGSKSGWWIFSSFTDGHAWVCDGFKTTYYCEIGSLYTFLHMNWGWNDDYANGWFAYNNWNPTTSDGSTPTYNYKRGMVYNIIP